MATIIKKEEHDWQPHPNRIDGFRMFTDMARAKAGVEPKWLNFDLRKLPPGEYNAAYHFHRYAEELFPAEHQFPFCGFGGRQGELPWLWRAFAANDVAFTERFNT